MNNPDISIVMPVYNAEIFLSESIDSILKQSFRNFELICVDDGSNDSSGDILDQYASIDTRIRVLHLESNMRVGRARNIGISLAKGKYLISCDADDTLPENALNSLYSAATAYDSDAIIGSLQYMDQSSNKENLFKVTRLAINIDIFHAHDLLIHFLGYHVCILFKRSYIDFYSSPYKEDCLASSDGHFLFRIMFDVKKVTLIEDIVYNYRLNPSSITNAPRTLRWCTDDLDAFRTLYKKALTCNAKSIADERFYYEFLGMVLRAYKDLTNSDFFHFIDILQSFIKEYVVHIPQKDDTVDVYGILIFLSILYKKKRLAYFFLKQKREILYALKFTPIKAGANYLINRWGYALAIQGLR